MAIGVVDGRFEFKPTLPGEPAALTVYVPQAARGAWAEAVGKAQDGGEGVVRMPGGLTLYLKSRSQEPRWMLARPDAESYVVTLALTQDYWDEWLGCLAGNAKLLDWTSRAARKPWNNLTLAFVFM